MFKYIFNNLQEHYSNFAKANFFFGYNTLGFFNANTNYVFILTAILTLMIGYSLVYVLTSF